MSTRCIRCGRHLEHGQLVLEVRVAVVEGDEISTDRSNEVMHTVCPADYSRRLN